ncbi:hypothetical protein SFRURICE_005581 [Spodoptera frugiperda]|nr:hypothetical protein SFRURICE_009643 [Spodoptera frugiperda]KAF9804158.1 hypothetical protein SFRURICE_020586 [Spodoptera frugiperda]KAF9806843.1 hypothetical protein SFRURICE_008543 [Spodoptera frugiperda]KAF9808333.1 hypothetical protein SFRURICE_008386 [Spodoptera frugiperda]KAF9819621.1 hypothetical protein SFRURICE_005574 [Spodoptera frugiperda]
MELLFNSVHCTVTLLKLLMGPAFPTDYSEKKCRNKLRGLSHSQSANMVTKLQTRYTVETHDGSIFDRTGRLLHEK